jgi:hypothetical protein
MKSLRCLGTALWLALALLKGSTPSSNTCDECFACAQLGAAVGIEPPAIPQGEATEAVPRPEAWSSSCIAPRLAFLSTGPPALL